MIKKSFQLIVAQIIFSLSFCSATFGSASDLKVYPLPIVEAKMVVSDWLMDTGFEVKRISSARGQVDIAAIKGQEGWQISLNSHSPLATRITATTGKNGQAEPLWSHISAYLKQISSHSSNRNSQITTSTAVISRTKSVVCLKTTGAEEPLQLSGFAINAEGVILCTAHGLEVDSRVMVILHDGSEIEGRVVRLDALKDLAIVLVRARLPQVVDLSNGRHQLEKNERLFSVGCPLNVLGVIQTGTLHGVPRRLHGWPLWQVDMAMQPGSSGSPVFDVAGNLVGMAKGRYRGTDSFGFIIPVKTLLDFVKEE